MYSAVNIIFANKILMNLRNATGQVSLNKVGQDSCSSREAIKYIIKTGRVTINNKIARKGGVGKPNDVVAIDGEKITTKGMRRFTFAFKPVVLLLPIQVISSITSIIPGNFSRMGRLDKIRMA